MLDRLGDLGADLLLATDVLKREEPGPALFLDVDGREPVVGDPLTHETDVEHVDSLGDRAEEADLALPMAALATLGPDLAGQLAVVQLAQ